VVILLSNPQPVSRKMNYKFSQFEVKHSDANNWLYISEVAALEILQNNFKQIAPIISQMLQGKEITTRNGRIRIRRQNSDLNSTSF